MRAGHAGLAKYWLYPYTNNVTQVIVELDDALARRLEGVAPARQRLRAGFIRDAIRRALDARMEEQMARAYREHPQDESEPDLDPATWEHLGPRRTKSRGRR